MSTSDMDLQPIHPPPRSFLRRYVFATDHKVIAKQFLWAGLLFLMFGGLLAMLIRWQWAYPGQKVPVVGEVLFRRSGGVITPAAYNAVFTMHGLVMIFFAITPVMIGAFGNFCIPLMIGARDMAFPRLNMLSFWTFVGSLVLYGPTAIQFLRVVGTAYVKAGTGFQPVSLEFVAETLRGLAAGFGSLALVGAIPFLILVAIGTLSLLRRAWIVVLSFIIPLVLLAAVVVMAGWLTSPRFFILIVPLAFLVAVECLDLVARLIARRFANDHTQSRVHHGLAGAAVVVCALALAFGLPRYYAVPKQPFKAAITAFNARARQGDALVAMYQAFWGFDYYSRRLGLDGQQRFYSAPTPAVFDSLGTQLAGRRVLLATTFERAFKLEQPEMWKQVEEGWTRVETLPATVGYGEVSLWEPKPTAAITPAR